MSKINLIRQKFAEYYNLIAFAIYMTLTSYLQGQGHILFPMVKYMGDTCQNQLLMTNSLQDIMI